MKDGLNPWRWGAKSEQSDSAAMITGPERVGIIDGVQVDFRHPDVDSSRWEPRPWWYLGNADSALVWFPSHPYYGNSSIDRRCGTVEVYPGDKLTLGKVKKVTDGATFLHNHDKIHIDAEVVLTRASGEVHKLPEPLPLFGNLELRNGPSWRVLPRMEQRALEATGLQSLYDEPSSHYWAQKKGIAMEAAYFIRATGANFREVGDLLNDKNVQANIADGWVSGCVQELLDDALLAGYFLAKSEYEELEQGTKKRDEILAAGRLSLKDFDGRRDLAKGIWKSHPTYTINRVSQLVAQELGKDKASIMASLWEIVPESSPSYDKAQEKVMSGQT